MKKQIYFLIQLKTNYKNISVSNVFLISNKISFLMSTYIFTEPKLTL